MMQVQGAETELREFVGGEVDRVVVAGMQRANGDERHAADESFAEHRAVAIIRGWLFVDHLRRRAGAMSGGSRRFAPQAMVMKTNG